MPAALARVRCELRYDIIVEGVTWFEFLGSLCPRRIALTKQLGSPGANNKGDTHG